MANLLDQASIVLTPTAYDNGKVLCAKPSEAPYGDFDFSRNSAATRVNAQGLVENVQILSSNLVQNGDFSEEGVQEVSNGSFSQEGVELVTNGDFATDSDWNKGDGWSISEGSANCDGTQTVTTNFSQPNVISDQSKTYKVEFTLSNYVSGSVKSKISNDAQGVNRTANGTYVDYLSGMTNTQLNFTASSDFIGSIDNVSVREVGQDWDFVGEAELTEQGARILNTGFGQSYINQNALANTKSYKISYDIVDSTQGSLKLINVNGVSEYPIPSTIGSHTVYFTANNDILFIFRNSGATDVTITNISVKEVGMDWLFSGGAEITAQGARINNTITGANAFVKQVNSNLTIGKSLVFQYDVVQTNGKNLAIEQIGGNISLNTSTIGNNRKVYFEFDRADASLIIKRAAAATDVTITNISVIEVTDDTNLPRINYEGFSYQDALGSELVTNGDFATDSDWTKTGEATISGGYGNIISTTGASSELKQTILQIGVTYKYSVEVVSISSGGIQIFNGSPLQIATSIGTYTGTFVATNAQFRLIRNGVTNGSIDNVSVKEYLGQEVVPNSGCGSWLWEPQTTQLVTYSEDFSQWNLAGTLVLESGYLAPDGTNNATKITSSDLTGFLSTQGGFLSSTTKSIYARSVSGTGTVKLLSKNDNTNNTFTLTEQWQRFDVNNTTTAPTLMYGVDFRNDATLNEIILWGANATNDQDYPTSYIPTSGSQVTRNQDVCNNGGSLATINSTEGTLYAEIAALANDGTFRVLGLSDGTNTNRAYIGYSLVNQSIFCGFDVNSTSIYSVSYNTTDITSFIKVALKYKQNDFALWVNGVEVSSQSSGITFPIGTLISSQFNSGGGNSPFFGKTKALAVWQEALSDEELAELTYPTPTDPTFTLDFDTIAEQFTFARGSEATYVDAQGLIKSTNEIGSELITNGDFDTDGYWNLAGGATISDGKANITGDGSVFTNISQGGIFTSGKQYVVKADVVINSGLGLKFQDGANNENIGFATTSGTYTFYFTATANSTLMIGRRAGGTAFDSSIDNVSVKEVTTATNTPRLDYSTGAEAFLLEPQSTNLVTYSSDLSNAAWGNYNFSGANMTEQFGVLSPDGSNNATRLTYTNTSIGSGGSLLTSNITLVANAQYTISFYAKHVSGTKQIRVDLKNTSSAGVSGASFTLTNEWKRYTKTVTNDSGTNRGVQFRILESQFQGDRTFDVWGVQLEQQSYATSYIPTNGSQTTRNQETCINATPEINSEEGVLYTEISALADDETNRSITLSDGGTQNYVMIRFNSGHSNWIYTRVNIGGSHAYFNINVSNVITDFNKIAIRYQDNNFATFINGVKTQSQLSGSTFAANTLTELSFDSGGGGDNFFGNTKDVQVYTKALSDAELIKLTT